MKFLENQKNEFIENISVPRLKSYGYELGNQADISEVLSSYIYNIKVSEAFYPILSILEITLRNRLHNAIDILIKKNWLKEELISQNMLKDNEYRILLEAEKKVRYKNKNVTTGALIAELSFGFWINLCKKTYKTVIWDKKGVFDFVFPFFPDKKLMDKIKFVSIDLKVILNLRNRIFHHEIIINHKYGINNCYKLIETIISYMIIYNIDSISRICRFKEVIKQKP